MSSRRPGLLRAAAGASLGVQAATARRHLAYPLLETAGATCPTSPYISSSDTTVHADVSHGEYCRPYPSLYMSKLKASRRGMGGSPLPQRYPHILIGAPSSWWPLVQADVGKLSTRGSG